MSHTSPARETEQGEKSRVLCFSSQLANLYGNGMAQQFNNASLTDLHMMDSQEQGQFSDAKFSLNWKVAGFPLPNSPLSRLCYLGTGRGQRWAGLRDPCRQQGLDLERGASKRLLDGLEGNDPRNSHVEAVLLWSFLWKRAWVHRQHSCTRGRIIPAEVCASMGKVLMGRGLRRVPVMALSCRFSHRWVLQLPIFSPLFRICHLPTILGNDRLSKIHLNKQVVARTEAGHP